MALLPHPHSPEFPQALKAARMARGMSRAALARAANIHEVMPRRYEDVDCSEFSRPTANTYIALNRALGFTEDDAASTPSPAPAGVLLHEATIDEIVAELHKRNITATMVFGRPNAA
jgi:transcriptional regulator with XRE-family HTH domain